MAITNTKAINEMVPEDLTKDGIDDKEVVKIWSQRRVRMAERRKQFEPLWRNGVTRFFEGIVTGFGIGSQRLYNTLYEQYDFSVFSRDGMRFNNLKYPLLPAIVMRALASELSNRPKVRFIANGSNDIEKPLAFKYLFDQVLYEMDADQEDFEILLDRRVMGTSIALVMTEQMILTVKDPDIDKEGNMVFTKKTKKVKQCLYKKMDLRHVWLDEHCVKSSLKDCNYAQVDEYFSKEEFLMRFKDVDPAKLQRAISAAEKTDEMSTEYYNWFDKKDVEHVVVTHCFDKIADCYHIIANGSEVLNDVDAPIPRIAGRRGKDIPLALAPMYKIPNAPYGYGDSHITSTFNQIKNLVRVMILEITQKAAKPMLAIDPLSNFDEEGFEWGRDFVRVEPDKIKEIGINPNMRLLSDMDETADQDVIRATGVNINDTTNVDAGETARKSIIRRESQNAIIELGMNYMSSNFYKRLYTLLKDDVRLYYKEKLAEDGEVKVKTKDVMIERTENGIRKSEAQGFRYFDLKEEDLDFDMDLDLELGNMSTSKELEKALVGEAMNAIQPFLQGGAFDQAGLAKYLKDAYGMPNSVLAGGGKDSGFGDKSPEDIAKETLPPDMMPESVTEAMQGPAVEGMPQEGQSPINPAQIKQTFNGQA